MMTLEFKSFIANKKNLIVCGLIVVVIAMFNTNFKREFQYQITLNSLEKDIGRLEIELKNNPKDMAFQAFNQKQLAVIKAEKNAFVNKDYQTYWEKKIEQVGNISEDFKE
ncbi:MAG: hypothetical protein WAX16_00225 [Lactococcus raffinolactis]